MLPRHALCVLSRLRCNGHSLLLSSFLSRIGRIENPSCSACEHPSQDTFHLICTVQLRTLRCSLFGDSLSLYDLWSRPWGVVRLLGRHGLPPYSHRWEGVGNNKLCNSFRAAGTNRCLDFSLSMLAACGSVSWPCRIWPGSKELRLAKESRSLAAKLSWLDA